MNTYTIYDEFFTLGKLLKDAAIIETGSAAKNFLANHDVLYNGSYENRRGKKLFDGDVLEFPDLGLTLNICAASAEEIAEHQAELAEEARVKAIVKTLNDNNKKAAKNQKSAANNKAQYFKRKTTKPKFPGTK